MLMFAWCRLVP